METFEAAPGETSPSDMSSIRYDASGKVIKLESAGVFEVEVQPGGEEAAEDAKGTVVFDERRILSSLGTDVQVRRFDV